MKQAVVTKFGDPSVIKIRDIDIPEPKDNEIRIKVDFSGINFAEIMMRMGLYPGAGKPPCPIGAEASGTIDKIGKNVSSKLEINQKVMTFSFQGTHASYICVPSNVVMPIPEFYNMKEAAGFPVIFFTAYMMLFDLGNIKPKDRILIHGGGGGMGTTLIQFCNSIGTTIHTTSSAWKHEKLYNLGVDKCVDYLKNNYLQKLTSMSREIGGYDIIIDPLGGESWKQSYKLLSSMGKLIIYGDQSFVSGYKRSIITMLKEYFTVPKFNTLELISKNKSIMGFHLGRLKNSESKLELAEKSLIKIINEHKIKPTIDKMFPYDQIPEAHKYIQDRKNLGKVLIDFTKSV